MAASMRTSSSTYTPASASSEGQQEGSCLLELLPLSCWSAAVDLLSARDMLCLSISSKALQQLLNSTPGIWCQAARNCLLTAAVPNSSLTGSTASSLSSSSIQVNSAAFQQVAQGAAAAWDGNSDAADAAARQMLRAFTGLASSCQRLRPQMKPQAYLLPPWLAAQPGKARGFVQLESQLLNPTLMLSEAEVHWLSLGCLSGTHVLTSAVVQCTFLCKQLHIYCCMQPKHARCCCRMHSTCASRCSMVLSWHSNSMYAS
jgi:hypothetical protein